MGFLSKAFKKVKKQIQPDNMIARDMGPGNMPKRPDIFGRDSFLFGRRPRGNMGSDFRAPRMPRMPRIDDGRMRAMPVGPGVRLQMPQLNFGMEQMPTSLGDRMIGTPQPIPEQMPTDPSSYYNPTIFGQQMGDMDFSQMPEISPVDMSNLQMPTLPREISQMDIPQMPEGLPSMQDVQGGRDLQQDFPTQRRMMMAEGDEVINIIDALQEYGLTVPREVAEQLSSKSGLSLQSINEIINEGGRTMSNMDRQMGFKAAGSIGLDDQGNPVFPEYSEGGEAFPDLTGDGKVTQADILKGRGVYAEGDEVMMMEGNEIESMLSGMDSSEQEAMGELEQMAPEMEMIDQLVMMVVQMIQQGAGEEEVIMFLREQGLDDEDIGTVLQLVAEMSETEEMAEDQIGNELAQLG